VSSIAAIGQNVRRQLKRVVGGVLAVLVLLAVPALGLAHLGSDLLASWQQGRDAEQTALAPWTFDAPASTVAHLKARTNGSLSAPNRGDLPLEMALVLEDWRYTGLLDQLIGEAQVNAAAVLNVELNVDLFLFLTGQTQTLEFVLFQQLFLNSVMNQEFLTLLDIVISNTPTTPVSPST